MKSRDRDNCKKLLRDCVYVLGYEGVIMKLNDLLTVIYEISNKDEKDAQFQVISKTEGLFECLKTLLKDSRKI